MVSTMVINEGLLPSEKISCTKYRMMYRVTLSPLGILDFLLIRMSDEALTLCNGDSRTMKSYLERW
jgi:hypothetical protein